MDCMERKQRPGLGGNPCTGPRPINIQHSSQSEYAISVLHLHKIHNLPRLSLSKPNLDFRLIPLSNVGCNHVDKRDILIKVWYMFVFKTASKFHMYVKVQALKIFSI